MATASAKALGVLRLLYVFWKAAMRRFDGTYLREDLPGLTECLEAGWAEASEFAPGKYRITEQGKVQLQIAGDDVADEHD